MISKIPKFRNIRCEWKGIKFQSKLERDFYVWIENNNGFYGFTYKFQESFKLIGTRKYVADFVLFFKTGKKLVIDVKSMATVTQIFKFKQEIMKLLHDIDVHVVYNIDDLIKLIKTHAN